MKNVNKRNSKLKNYQIPDNAIIKTILDIKNQILKAKFNFFKNGKENLIKINKNMLKKELSSDSLKQNEIINSQKNLSLHKSYLINKKLIPALLKSVITTTKNRNNSNNLSKSSSLNLTKEFNKENKKRPLSSCNINNKNYSLNNHIFQLINQTKNNLNPSFPSSKSNNKIESNKSVNFPITKDSIFNSFNNKSTRNRNSNFFRKEFKTSLSNTNTHNKIKYKLKLKNKSQIIENSKEKYNDIFFKEKLMRSITPSSDKLNIIKNNRYFTKSNRASFSKINNENLKYYSLDNHNKNNSNNIRQYFFYKDNKTKSLDYLLDNKNNNESELIHYKNVFYSSKNKNSHILDKIKNYNSLIRSRNVQNKKNKGKKYTFYKYKEYMSQIEKEEIDNFYKEKEKNHINIQAIFADTSAKNENKKNKLFQNNFSNEEAKNININYNYKVDIIQEEETNINNENNDNSSKGSEKNKRNSLIKKKKSKKMKKKEKDDESESSYSQSDVIINNFENDNKNKQNIENKENIEKKENIEILKNIDNTINDILIIDKKRKSFKETMKEENTLFDQENNKDGKRKMTDPDNMQDEQNESPLNEKIDNEMNNPNFNIVGFYLEMKSNSKTKNMKILDLVKKNYMRKKERIMLINKRNQNAQKLLLEKIKEAEKYQKGRRPSQFMPFFNLKYKYLENESTKNKENIQLKKYYEKNISINKFNVRLKHKSTISYNNNTNNSLNSSINDFFDQFSEFRSNFGNINFKENDINNDISKNSNNEKILDKDIIKDSTINLNDKESSSNITFPRKKGNFYNSSKNIIPESIKNIISNDEAKDEEKNELDNRKDMKDDKISEFMKAFFEKYEKNEKEKNITEEIYEDANHKYSILLKENDDIIRNSDKKESELFLDFKEKMNSLEKFSKQEFSLYIIRNYKVILNILEEIKRDRKKEYQINEFLKALNEDFDKLFDYKRDIFKHIKIVNYQPFYPYLK